MKACCWSAVALWIMPLFSAAQQVVDLQHKNGMPVGHIAFDPALDDAGFKCCGAVIGKSPITKSSLTGTTTRH